MLTVIVGYALILLATGQPIARFPTQEACIIASYQASFQSGQETRCEPVYRSVSR